MTLFSQRKGLKPVRSTLQVDSMDVALRSRLWDIVVSRYWDGDFSFFRPSGPSLQERLIRKIWHQYFKRPLDTIKSNWSSVYHELRQYFFDCEWYEVYDFIEFLSIAYAYEPTNTSFRATCNVVLEQELAGYRFVGNKITQITTKEEIESVEEATQLKGKLQLVSKHIQQSLNLLADRKKPDYRNSIKEAISAVESVCRIVTDSPKATLGDAIKKMEGKVKIHPSLRSAFEKLYGYTNDADGIRHALLQETDLGFVDAKYMLVSCSAFVNYVVAKSAESGIVL
jgi:hypothetical protein